MPTIVGTAVETNLLGVLQGTLNGNTSILTPSGRTFYDPGTSVPGSFRYDGFVTKRGTLSVDSLANGTVLTLQSSHEAAQFRAGDACFLVGNAYAGVVGAADNTADAVFVVSTSPVNQTVTVDAATRAGGVYNTGASLVMVSASAPGAMVNSASAGAPLDNQVAAELLTSLENHCNSTLVAVGGGSTFTTFDADNGNVWTEIPTVIGATLTMLTCPATPANVGVSATVVGAAVGDPSVITLTDFRDANGDSIAQWPVAPVAADTASLQLDLSEGKLAELGAAGGDYTRLVAAALTMHRKLDVINQGLLLAPTAPEIPLINEWNMMGQGTGTMLRLSLPYVNATDDFITLEWNDAAGDLPLPLSGTVRVINARDGVGGTAWNIPVATTSLFVVYTRQKNSNVLTFTAGVGALAANFGTGCIAMLNPAINGFAKTSGFSAEVPGKYLSGLLWQLAEAVENYTVLSA